MKDLIPLRTVPDHFSYLCNYCGARFEPHEKQEWLDHIRLSPQKRELLTRIRELEARRRDLITTMCML